MCVTDELLLTPVSVHSLGEVIQHGISTIYFALLKSFQPQGGSKIGLSLNTSLPLTALYHESDFWQYSAVYDQTLVNTDKGLETEPDALNL